MAKTELKRKDRRNKMKAIAGVEKIKKLNTKPVIRKVDIEELKKDFS